MNQVLMPKATAVWLVDNTSLTFDQIADFCVLHPLEVKGIADGEVARDIRGADPIANGQLSREELDAAEKDPNYRMKAQKSRHAELLKPIKKGPRYTPVSRRQDRPDAIAWFVRNHPEVADSQIAKLLGTTKATIDAVRDRTHWNSANIKPVDPVTLGLVGQLELDDVVRKAADKKAPRYTPVARRQDRPDAIAWFIKHHPEVTDAQIAKFLGTTKATIETVRTGAHWNKAQIKPVDPVTLGLGQQLELDALIKKAAEKKARDDKKRGVKQPEGETLKPASETTAEAEAEPDVDHEPEAEHEPAYADGHDDEDED